MKILFCIPEVGNAPYACANRYNTLLEKFEADHVYVCSSLGKPLPSARVRDSFTLNLNCRQGRLSSRFLKEILYASYCILILIYVRPQKTVVSSPNYFSMLCIALVCAFLRRTYILDIRDLYPDVLHITNKLNRTNYLYRCLEYLTKRIYANAQLIICATNGIVRSVQNYGITSRKIQKVTNGYPSVNGRLTDLSDVTRDVIFVGTLGFMQNRNFLEAIVKNSPDVSYTFVTDQMSVDYFLTKNFDNLIVHSRMPISQVNGLLREHKVGVSIRTGNDYDKISLPVKIFEYLGAGLRVVGFPKTEFSDLVHDTSLLNETNSNDVAAFCQNINDFVKLPRPKINGLFELSRASQDAIFFSAIARND